MGSVVPAPNPDQASSSVDLAQGDEPELVVPKSDDLPSDDEAAESAHAHLLDLDAQMARSLSLGLRPRK